MDAPAPAAPYDKKCDHKQVVFATSIEQATTKNYFVDRVKRDKASTSMQEILTQELQKPLKRSASIMTENYALLTARSECAICAKEAMVPERSHQK